VKLQETFEMLVFGFRVAGFGRFVGIYHGVSPSTQLLHSYVPRYNKAPQT